MPENYRRCFDSWLPRHPEWRILLWDRESLSELKLENRWVLDIENPTIQSEVLRWEVVLEFGGIYLDADIECLRPIDALLLQGDEFVSMRNRYDLENNGFGSIADGDWVGFVVDTLTLSESRSLKVLDIDPIVKVATELKPVLKIPHHLLHASDNERDRQEFGDKRLAIHHRYSLWMKDDERYKDHYEKRVAI